MYSKYFPMGVSGGDLLHQNIYRKVSLFVNGIYSLQAKKGLQKLLDSHSVDVAHLHILHYAISPSIIDTLHNNNIPIVFSLHDYRINCAGGFLYTNGKECNKCSGGNYYHAVINRCYRGSTVSSLMGTIGNYLYRLIRLYEKVDMFTVPHENMAKLVAGFGIPDEKIKILSNPLAVETNTTTEKSEDYVLYFGNLSAQKGVITLVAAAEQLPQIPFVICGHGEALEEIKRLIEAKNLKNITIDNKTRWESGLVSVIKKARFVVSPSEWPTPLEYATLETMMLGKAIVASKIGGNESVIKNGITGLLFEPGNSHSLSDAISYLYGMPDKCEQMAQAAKQFVEENFSESEYYNNLVGIYNDAKMYRSNRK